MDLPTGLPQKLQRHLEPTDNDNDDADIVENNLLYQMVSLVGWLVLTISILLLFWASEPCVSRITARWKAPPKCVLEIGNAETLLSRLPKPLKRFISCANDVDGGSNKIIMVLPNEFREQFVELQLASKEAVSNRSPLTPVIFHGPSGTGKLWASFPQQSYSHVIWRSHMPW